MLIRVRGDWERVPWAALESDRDRAQPLDGGAPSSERGHAPRNLGTALRSVPPLPLPRLPGGSAGDDAVPRCFGRFAVAWEEAYLGRVVEDKGG